ncbi:hypothetical protein BS47DRAFT_294454 [Hydnum rufescens UP504]|uniref:Uncharacterized protein n=1 Tax=Hydnum rufescens UP504 TaxID=1448309 RepID=A0A9P6B608_9AGAM|nr:hypothetical protein BS47DRAFT_294454 [Hydnum rufescens UP504]
MTPSKIAVIAGVGTGGGIGGVVAQRFANIGYTAALLSRNAQVLQGPSDSINAAGGLVRPLQQPSSLPVVILPVQRLLYSQSLHTHTPKSVKPSMISERNGLLIQSESPCGMP